MSAPADINEPVRQEMKRFREALPRLLKGPYAGKWVVFKDGDVRTAHETAAEAHKAGARALGIFGGQVIAQVVEEKPLIIPTVRAR